MFKYSFSAAGALLAVVAATLILLGSSSNTSAAVGGPVVLMGIDAEDGGVGGHGPITVYDNIVQSVIANVVNGGSGVLVIGGGKDPSDDVTSFWDQIAADTGLTVTYVNGDTNIAAQSFAGFAMIAVVSGEEETSSGGLTQAENDALAARVGDGDADAAAAVGVGVMGGAQSGSAASISSSTSLSIWSEQVGSPYGPSGWMTTWAPPMAAACPKKSTSSSSWVASTWRKSGNTSYVSCQQQMSRSSVTPRVVPAAVGAMNS